MPASRRHFLRTAAAASLGAALAPSVMACGSARPRATDFAAIRRGVGTFTGRGGTIGTLVRPGGLALVDTQGLAAAQTCYGGLAERAGLDAPRLDLLVNTHHHGDHTGGNSVLAPLADLHVAHANVPGLQRSAAGRAREQGRDAEEPVVASTTFVVKWSAEVGDETISLRYHGPAHTAGDAVVLFERANVVHVGDFVFNRMPCFVDVAAGANPPGWIAALEAVHAEYSDDTAFIFGHGNPAHGITGTRADLLVMRDFLTALSEHVQRGIAGGTPLETLAVPRLPGFEEHYLESWAEGIPNAIRAVHSYFSAG